jgi:signal transduction histidine kinase/CheY-like chemotaxis protein
MSADPNGPWDEHSREFAFRCDEAGLVTHFDARSGRRLSLRTGESLLERGVPGTEDKLRAFLSRARNEIVAHVEVPMVVDGEAVTCSLSARPDGGGGTHVLGSWIPQEHSRAVRQVEESVQEVVNLNRQIVKQKREIEAQKAALERTLAELVDSNRGIETLHLELAEKAESLQRTADIRGRMVANVSHEFRTPLHTILGLSRLLMDGSDGPINAEQRKQIQFIRASAEELKSFVDDLLDLSSAEAGKTLMRPERFSAAEFLSGLRGTLRPLLKSADAVELRFEDRAPGLELHTDPSKLSQILRNLVSNALKFTERGLVEVTMAAVGDDVVFEVRDSGIGIARDDFDRIFEEFGQVAGEVQSRVKGTGLGLTLSRRLAGLLGGSLEVDSEIGKGSTFTLRVQRTHPEVRELSAIEDRPLDPSRSPILVVEDDRKTIFIYEKYLAMAGFQVVPARTIAEAERHLSKFRPAAIVLDVMLDGESSWAFLSRLKHQPDTREIPVLVVTVTNKEQKARALGADEFWLKPIDQDQLLRKLRSLKVTGSPTRVLVIDDDQRARYLISKFLGAGPYQLIEAATGADGVTAAHEHRPHVILLDFLLQQGTTAFDVLDELKADPLTRNIPVIIITSHNLGDEELRRLASQTEVILSKENLSRELAINRIRDALRKAGVGLAAPQLPP